MTALVRYQAGLLLRSHRWVGPVVVYALFTVFTGGVGVGGEALSAGLTWTAAALVPMAAWLTRMMLTAEPPEARACLAAARGPRRAQLAALITALAGGLVLGLGGVVYDFVVGKPPGRAGTYATTIVVGLVTMAICLAVGSAAGALCNPPVVRPVAGAFAAMIIVVTAALISGVSPANAAIREAGKQPHASAWAVASPLIVAVVLLAVTWAVSAILAARRS